MPEVSRELCARVDELARRLRRVRELRARESAGE
jgi:predicted transcriptional regulator